MIQITDIGVQTNDDILAKIKHRFDEGDSQIILLNPIITPVEEDETIYACNMIGIQV